MKDILYEAESGIARITLNRPDKLNALRVTTFEELEQALRDAAGDPDVGVVRLAGSGRAFCAGGDVTMAQTILTGERAGRKHYFGRMIAVSHQILMMDKPVICAIQGACVGGGAELMTFADLVLAGRSAFFVFNGTAIGGCSWWGAPQLLPVQVGMRRAEELLLLSTRVTADEAAEMGMINRVVDDEDLNDEADRVCQRILDLSEDGVRLTKAALRSVKEAMLASMTSSAEMNVSALGKPDLHAAFDAFLEGRPMSWRALRPGQPGALDGTQP
jgi:enoyl-CoA hydratase/carnithine racemase